MRFAHPSNSGDALGVSVPRAGHGRNELAPGRWGHRSTSATTHDTWPATCRTTSCPRRVVNRPARVRGLVWAGRPARPTLVRAESRLGWPRCRDGRTARLGKTLRHRQEPAGAPCLVKRVGLPKRSLTRSRHASRRQRREDGGAADGADGASSTAVPRFGHVPDGAIRTTPSSSGSPVPARVGPACPTRSP